MTMEQMLVHKAYVHNKVDKHYGDESSDWLFQMPTRGFISRWEASTAKELPYVFTIKALSDSNNHSINANTIPSVLLRE